jgi:ketosteroid isomerase-like protein
MITSSELPLATIERLVRACNAHDLEQLVALFDESYALEAPLHPQRSFSGREQVRRNWTQIFAAVPDLQARVRRSAGEGETVWTEWEMAGTRRDGGAHLMRGVFIFGVTGGKIHWGRMYLEPVDGAGGDMDAALREQLAARAPRPDGG